MVALVRGSKHMLAAITGGTGFIGRNLAGLHLAAGDRVRVLSRRAAPDLPSGSAVYQGDLADEQSDLHPFVADADVLYHCAGEIRHTQQMRGLHVEGTRRLLVAASGRVGRWVQLSSVGVYGPRRTGAINESAPIAPSGEYERTKAESDRLVGVSGIPYCILRPSIVFGKAMPSLSLRQMITMIDRGLFFFIGKPGASANYIHVRNVVHALQLCATHPQALGKAFNLSDHHSLEEFVGMLAAALGKTPPRLRLPEWLPRAAAATMRWLPGFPLSASRVDALTNRSHYPIERAQKEIGYVHQVSMQQGIDELVAEWKSAQ